MDKCQEIKSNPDWQVRVSMRAALLMLFPVKARILIRLAGGRRWVWLPVARVAVAGLVAKEEWHLPPFMLAVVVPPPSPNCLRSGSQLYRWGKSHIAMLAFIYGGAAGKLALGHRWLTAIVRQVRSMGSRAQHLTRNLAVCYTGAGL